METWKKRENIHIFHSHIAQWNIIKEVILNVFALKYTANSCITVTCFKIVTY